MIGGNPPPAVCPFHRGPVIGVVVEVHDSVNAPRIVRDLTEISFRSTFQTLHRESVWQRNQPCFPLLKKSVNG